MIRGLPDPSDARVVLVVGKGGVGKTTVAGALGVAWADRGVGTHLLSVDPAHSLADLFRLRLPAGEAVSCPCAPGLTLEELDAAGAARRWLRRARGPIRELMEAGTYLDEEDILGFLDGPLPGADELMASLRLVELSEGEADRIVVDTAPTGHALRLLEAAEVVAGWHAALEAMARKAAVVAGRLARREVRLEAEEFVDALGRDAAGFEALLRSADTCALLVSRPEAPVEAETRELREALEARGVGVAAEVVVHPETVERASPPRGCEALRAWAGERRTQAPSGDGSPRGPAPPAPAPRTPGGEPPAPRRAKGGSGELASLFPGGRDLLLFVGKGGVGKTTCAVACALALSESRRVGLLATDPAGTASGLLARVAEGRPAAAGGGLAVRQVEGSRDLRGFRRRHEESFRSLADRVGLDDRLSLDRAVVESFLMLSPPGLDELFALAALTERRSEEVLVVDASPTGHFLRLLETPDVALGWTRSLMRILLKYRSVLGLGELAEDLLRFSRRVRELQGRLSDRSRTGAFPVTVSEPLVEAETSRLCDALRRADVPVAAIVHNRCPPGRDGPAWVAPEDGGRADAAVVAAPELERPITEPEEALAFFERWERVA